MAINLKKVKFLKKGNDKYKEEDRNDEI